MRQHGLKSQTGSFNILCRCGRGFTTSEFVTHLLVAAEESGVKVEAPAPGDDFDQWRKNVESMMVQAVLAPGASPSKPPPPPRKRERSRHGNAFASPAVETPGEGRPKCGNCKFCVAPEHTHSHSGEYECHRFPPQAVVLPKTYGTVFIWPEVRELDSCGEHQRKTPSPQVGE